MPLDLLRMYEKWELKMLTVALKCHCTRVYAVDFSEYSFGRLEFCMKAFPFQLRRFAFELAMEKRALVRIYDFRRWLDTTDEDFLAMARGPNKDVAARLREEYKKTRYMPGYFGKPVYRPVRKLDGYISSGTCLFKVLHAGQREDLWI